ncbi:hypothetical protein F8388_015735 [Cannabis sativa]|uniref:La protein 1 n=1 Tax=Cannabis sativa TaxID=3483 RepID=A0A7J6DQP4_CANSA|nr:hypothetical protein F8388_015735 [Cannabis sativa]
MASLDEETSKKVLRQVEFYFGDSNLPRDNFLKNTISESEDGSILFLLALICSFTRMRTHLDLGDVKPDNVAEDTVKAVAETLRMSTFLKISEDGKKVGRTNELVKPEELIEQLDSRTVAVSPFEHNTKQEGVEAFFGKFAKVNSVRLPRHVADKRFFCGTALVEFSNEEDAENILKQSFDYAGAKLNLKPKKDFDAEREKETEEFEKNRSLASSKGKNSPEASYTKGLIVAFALKRISAEGSAEPNGTHEPANGSINAGTDGDNATEDVKTDNNKEEKVEGESVDSKIDLEKDGNEIKDGEKASEAPVAESEEKEEKTNAAATFKDNMEVILREDLKAVFGKFGTVKYVDFKMGEESGYIRFDEPEAVQKARAAAVLAEQGGLVVKNFVATLDPVTGDAEKDYWSLLLRGNQDKRDFKGNRGRGGKHNRGWKHGRSRDNDASGGRSAKAQKTN